MFVSRCLTGRTQGSSVYISSTATVCRHGGVKGQMCVCEGVVGFMTGTFTRKTCEAEGDQYLKVPV